MQSNGMLCWSDCPPYVAMCALMNVRSYACQKAFGHLGVPGVGRGTGEPAEIVNSVLGPHGRITQYMKPANREAHLERAARLYCRDVVRGLPSRLQRVQVRTEAAICSAQHRIGVLEAALASARGQEITEVRCGRLSATGTGPVTMFCSQVQHAMSARIQQGEAADTSSRQQALGSEAEYVRCRLALTKLQHGEQLVDGPADGGVSLGLLFPGADSVPVRQRSALVRTIEKQAAELENAHGFDPIRWQPGSVAWKRGLCDLAKGELRKLFGEIEVGIGISMGCKLVIMLTVSHAV
jgi:hypothetical protein